MLNAALLFATLAVAGAPAGAEAACAKAAGAPDWFDGAECAPCPAQPWYPCDRPDLCTCAGGGPPPPPPPPPPAPGTGGGTCGGGRRGNGACADGNLCCSPYGWCGTSSAHCAGSPPPPPLPPAPTPPPHHQSPHGPPASGNGSCGNGSRGNGICPNGLCCSPYGWCGSTAAHCAGNPLPPAPTPPPPSPTGGAQAYVTYHNYFAGQPLTQVSCSDGQNGLITRWGYSTIDPMAPYVAATSVSAWNSPNCGKCYEVAGAAGTVYLTAIDRCAPAPGGGMHFDIHPVAFRELMGDAGVTAGVGYASFREVASSNCRGNRG